jgi:hypothetical protein
MAGTLVSNAGDSFTAFGPMLTFILTIAAAWIRRWRRAARIRSSVPVNGAANDPSRLAL